MNVKRRKYIRKAADDVRNLCAGSAYGIENIFKDVTERLHYQLVRYPIGERKILGFAQLREEERIIFVNSSVILSREIFSVAHEIGHMVLHINDQQCIIEDMDFAESSEIEAEANYFAACLLMPEEKVQKYIDVELDSKDGASYNTLDVARIMSAFNVSFEVVLNRLDTLCKITASDRVRLENERYKSTVTNLLSVINGAIELCQASRKKTIPPIFLSWVFDNYNDGVISQEVLQKALAYVGKNMEDVEGMLTLPKQVEDEPSLDELDALIGGIKE